MTLKELLTLALMQLTGASMAYDQTFWQESVIGSEVVNFHTEAERAAHKNLMQAVAQAHGALAAAANVAEKDRDDDDDLVSID